MVFSYLNMLVEIGRSSMLTPNGVFDWQTQIINSMNIVAIIKYDLKECSTQLVVTQNY